MSVKSFWFSVFFVAIGVTLGVAINLLPQFRTKIDCESSLSLIRDGALRQKHAIENLESVSVYLANCKKQCSVESAKQEFKGKYPVSSSADTKIITIGVVDVQFEGDIVKSVSSQPRDLSKK